MCSLVLPEMVRSHELPAAQFTSVGSVFGVDAHVSYELI